MIKIIQKDITTVTNGIVAHGCNCLGYMSAGVALAIARKWPKVLQQYKMYLGYYGLDYAYALGKTQLVVIDSELFVANCFTQLHVGFDKDGNPPANLTAIKDSLREVIFHCNDSGMDLYTPQIGCGLGGLDWETQVKPIYETLAEELDEDLNWYICTI